MQDIDILLLIEIVNNQFGLHEVLELKQINNHNSSKLIYKLVNGSEIYCLEVFQGSIQYAKAKELLMSTTSMLGYLIPRVIPTLSGCETYSINHIIPNTSIRIHTWLSGDSYNFNNILQLKSAGKCLGELHKNLSIVQISETDPIYLKNKLTDSYLNNFGDKFEDIVFCFHQKYQNDIRFCTIIIWIDNNIAQFKKLIKECTEFSSKPASQDLRLSLLHGDFTPNNVLFINNSIQGILDFTSVKYDCCLRELVWSSILFAYSRDNNNSQNISNLQAFINQYVTEYADIKNDLNYFYYVALMRFLKIFVNQLKKSVASDYVGEYIYDTTPYLKFILDNRNYLLNIKNSIC